MNENNVFSALKTLKGLFKIHIAVAAKLFLSDYQKLMGLF